MLASKGKASECKQRWHLSYERGWKHLPADKIDKGTQQTGVHVDGGNDADLVVVIHQIVQQTTEESRSAVTFLQQLAHIADGRQLLDAFDNCKKLGQVMACLVCKDLQMINVTVWC
jgi:hypothetical protein